MSNPTPADFKQLRKRFFDGSDHFMRGSAIHGKSWSSHATRVENISITDPWAFDDEQVRLVLLRSFPNMNTERETKEQRRRVRTWVLIIQWYFREGITANRIVLRLNNMRLERVQIRGADAKQVEDTIRRIRNAAAGLRTTGKPRTNTRGRPKNIVPQVLTGQQVDTVLQ